MGLDIYAGTLTRYYLTTGKLLFSSGRKKMDGAFKKITPDGEAADNEEEMSPAEIQAAVENWRDQILSAISQPGQPPYTPWPEDNEKPYYTDKPDWDAFGAMLLVAACIHTMSRCLPPWRRTGTSGNILWSPVLHRTRSGCGPCSVGQLGGCLWRMPSFFRHLCPPTIRL